MFLAKASKYAEHGTLPAAQATFEAHANLKKPFWRPRGIGIVPAHLTHETHRNTAEELNKIEVVSINAASGIEPSSCYCYSLCAEEANGCGNALSEFLVGKWDMPQFRRHPSLKNEANLTIVISPGVERR